jgi:muconolactone delta-isomerase
LSIHCLLKQTHYPTARSKTACKCRPSRVAELAAQGHALRVWNPLPEDGRRRALGLYRAASDEELEAILNSLPLRPWMEVSVTALAEHPNDPARSAA